MADEDANEAVSVHSSSESPTVPSTEQQEEDDAHMEDDDSATSPLPKRVIASAIVRPFLTHVLHKMKCWRQKMRSDLPPQDVDLQVAAPHRTPLSPQSNEDRGLRLVPGEFSPKSCGNHLLQHPDKPLGSIPEHEQPPATQT